MQEIWKDIKGYEGRYQISNLGRVKSLTKSIWNGYTFRIKDEFILKGGKDKKGYLYVILSKDGIKSIYKIHRLVAQFFIPNPENKLEVNHIDGNKLNNSVNNLEWCTHQENIYHACTIGLRPNYRNVNQYDLQGNFIRCWNCISDISKTLKINQSAIWQCCVGKSKKSHGFIWRYAD
jgi:hypothetical protein